jgi:hypothetical protein
MATSVSREARRGSWATRLMGKGWRQSEGWAEDGHGARRRPKEGDADRRGYWGEREGREDEEEETSI